MTRQAAFHELQEALQAACEALEVLHTAVVHDLPTYERPDTARIPEPARRLDDAVLELLGWVKEAQAELGSTLPGPQALAACNRSFSRARIELYDRLLCYEHIRDLRRLGRTQGGEWPGWARIVQMDLDLCRLPFARIDAALLSGWEELNQTPAGMHLFVSAG